MNDRIIRWQCLLEECGPTHVHIKGENNVAADALSGLDKEDFDAKIPEGKLMSMCLTRIDHDEGLEEPPLHCFASLTDEELERFPVSPPLIAKEQHKETNFKQKLLKSHGDSKVSDKTIEDVQLTTVNDKIAIPASLSNRVMEWCHDCLNHPGATGMHKTLAQLFHWPNMKAHCEHHVKHCGKCQLCKQNKKKCGKLPHKDVEKSEPWNRVNVDLIGPLPVHTANGKFILNALTIVDPATGWFEVVAIKD